MEEDKSKQPSVTFLQIVGSILASFFGVQSEERRRRDFDQGKPIHYIIVGLLATLVLILSLWAVIKIILTMAGV